MIEDIKDLILKEWENFFTTRPKVENIKPLIVNSAYGKTCSTIILFFEKGNCSPFCSAKVPLFKSAEQCVENDHNMRRLLYPTFNVPQPISINKISGWSVSIQSVSSDISLIKKKFGRSDIPALIDKITETVTDIHAHNANEKLFDDIDFERYIAAPSEKIISKDLDKVNGRVLSDMVSSLKSLIGEKIPFVYSNNNVTADNITIGEKISIANWDFSEKIGLPFIDLYTAWVDSYVFLNGMSFNNAIDCILLNKNRDVFFERLTDRYCSRLNTTRDLSKKFVLLYILRRLILADEILFPLQAFDGLDWMKNRFNILKNNNLEKYMEQQL